MGLVWIGNGAFGVAYKIEYTLKMQNSEVVLRTRAPEKQHVVKVMTAPYNLRWKGFKTRVNYEYLCMTAAGYFDARTPIYDKAHKRITITMRCFPGETLYHKIIRHQQTNQKMSVYERLLITRQLFISYREQLKKHDIIHRDIKPENVMVELVNGQACELNYIDLGLSIFTKDQDHERVGTLIYMSPEVHHQIRVSNKSDLYSIGRVLWELWDMPFDFDKGYGDAKFISTFQNLTDAEFDFLFKSTPLNDMPQSTKRDLKNLIVCLNKKEAKDRPELDNIIEWLNKLISEYRCSAKAPEHAQEFQRTLNRLNSSLFSANIHIRNLKTRMPARSSVKPKIKVGN